MKRFLFVISIFFLIVPTLWADTDVLVPDGLGSPDQWAFNNVSKVADVTDGVDANFILETVDEEDQVFSLSNTTFDAGDTIDSIVIVWRAQDNGSGNNRAQMKLTDGSGNVACEGANQALTTSFVTYTEDGVTATPTATGCDGALTKTLIDAMLVRVDCTSVANQLDVTDIDVVIHFTVAGEAPAGRRRRILISSLNKFPEMFKYGMDSNNWLWGNG